jgi:lipopolysaccharide export system permease protein
LVGGIIHRLIVRELLRVFLLSLVATTGVLLLGGVVAEVAQQGLSPAQVWAIVPLLLPSMLPYAIPATTLFAVCVVYGRLAADNELLALRGSGVPLTCILAPALAFGLAASALSATLHFRFIPNTYRMLRARLVEDLEEVLYARLRERSRLDHANLDYCISVEGVQGRRLVNPVVMRRDVHRNITLVAAGREGELSVDVGERQVRFLMRTGEMSDSDGIRAEFEEHELLLPLPDSMFGSALRRSRDMTWEELNAFAAVWHVEREELCEDLTCTLGRIDGGTAAETDRLHARLLKGRIKRLGELIGTVLVEKQMRPALALGCVAFALLGFSVAVRLACTDYLSVFIVCFLPIVCCYYPLLLCGASLGKTGHVPALLTIWIADWLAVVAGVLLLRRLCRH